MSRINLTQENLDPAIKQSKFFQLIPQEVKNGNRETDKMPSVLLW